MVKIVINNPLLVKCFYILKALASSLLLSLLTFGLFTLILIGGVFFWSNQHNDESGAGSVVILLFTFPIILIAVIIIFIVTFIKFYNNSTKIFKKTNQSKLRNVRDLILLIVFALAISVPIFSFILEILSYFSYRNK